MSQQKKSPDPKTFNKLYSRAVNFISYKPRTEREVRLKLNKYSQDISIIDLVVKELKEIGLVSDTKYVLEFIDSTVNSHKPRNIQKIKNFLYKKGVSPELINEELKNIPKDYDFQVAYKQGEKKLKTLSKLSDFQKKKKIMEFLARKGYPYETVKGVVDNLL